MILKFAWGFTTTRLEKSGKGICIIADYERVTQAYLFETGKYNYRKKCLIK